MPPSVSLLHASKLWVDVVRLQSWFPFTVDICLNGRELLTRQLDQCSIAYQQRDNCLVRVADPKRAQDLLNQQLATNWKEELDTLLTQAHPKTFTITSIHFTLFGK